MIPIYRCDCGFGTVMHRPYCPKCRGRLRPAQTIAEGRVLSWTILSVVPEGFPSPVGLAVVGLAAGMNAIARFDPAHPLAIRAHVQVTLRDGLRWIDPVAPQADAAPGAGAPPGADAGVQR